MNEIAVCISEDLNFDMPRPAHQLFEKNFVLAEGGFCLPLGAQHAIEEFVFAFDWAHATPASAPGGLEHEGITDLTGETPDLLRIAGQKRGRRHDRHAAGRREIPCGELIAKVAQNLWGGADESDARRRAGFGEFRTLRKKTI